ncbi:MAG: hypothetical protein ACRDPJ_09395 [Nocardioidaceae bacterium]
MAYSSAEEFEIRPEPDRMPGLDFVRLDETKKADFRPDDQDAEVARLVAHGAQRVDIGQGVNRGSYWQIPKVTSSASLPLRASRFTASRLRSSLKVANTQESSGPLGPQRPDRRAASSACR